MIVYELIRSARRTLDLSVRGEHVIVRAPLRMPLRDIDGFVNSHENWINKKLAENIEKAKNAEQIDCLSEEEIRSLAEKACEYIPRRVGYYAAIIGVTYGRIVIRCQKTLWGSCSVKGNLNFNCLLMLTPQEVIDSIIVHELCHRRQMNHSKRFYAEVYRVFPEYKKWNKWLRDNGGTILNRLRR